MAVAQRAEVRAAQCDFDEFACDLDVPEVQRGHAAANDSAPLAWLLKAKACDAIAGLARVPDRLHRLYPSLVWIPPGHLDIALLWLPAVRFRPRQLQSHRSTTCVLCPKDRLAVRG
jgi:hypothetical protein